MNVTETLPILESKLLNRRAEPKPPVAPTPENAEAIAICHKICDGQPLALRFLMQAMEVALVFDHIVDGDEINMESTYNAFENILTEWPNNQFIRDHSRSLTPIMANAIALWRYGNDRSSHYRVYADLASTVAFIVGGMTLVNKYMPRLLELIPVLIEQDDLRDA